MRQTIQRRFVRAAVRTAPTLGFLAGVLCFSLLQPAAQGTPIPRYRTVELPKERPLTAEQRGEKIGWVIGGVVFGGLYLVMRARSGRE